MKRNAIRTLLVIALLLVAGLVSAQPRPNERVWSAIGLSEEEIEAVAEIEREAANELRLYQADLEIKKAELARLLLESSPNMRQVERNLEETAELEVSVRLAEINRELAIRDLVGEERWSAIIQTMRTRRGPQQEGAQALMEGIAGLQQEFAARQRAILRALESDSEQADEVIRQQLAELQTRLRELQQALEPRQR